MANTLSRPAKSESSFKRVAVLFAGGPAPAANAVISTCATSFLRNDIQVLGILHGYSSLIDFSPEKPLEAGRDFIVLDHKTLKRTRNSQGILIGTARQSWQKCVTSDSLGRPREERTATTDL